MEGVRGEGAPARMDMGEASLAPRASPGEALTGCSTSWRPRG